MDYYVKSVIPVIESNYENFTALEKNIADFFMKNEEKMDFSAKEIAKHLFVSEASLSRFAKKCGFRGYREFIYQYEESFEEKNKELTGHTRTVLNMYQELLNKTYSLMDEAQIIRICEKLGQAKSVRMWERKFRPCSERDASKIYENWSRYQFDSRSRSDENAGSIPKGRLSCDRDQYQWRE